MKRRRGNKQPAQGEGLLDGLFRRLGLQGDARKWRAIGAWHEAVGDDLARRVRAEDVRGSTLVLRVTSSAWANQLGFLKAKLLDQLRATSGAEWIEDLRFNVGPLDEIPDWNLDERPIAPAPVVVAPPAPDDALVAEALQGVTDPELRETLAEIFAKARMRERIPDEEID